MATNVSPPNRSDVTIVTARLDGGALAKVHVIPNRQGLIRLSVGFDGEHEPILRTLGEISRDKAQALLDALATALDVTDENGNQA